MSSRVILERAFRLAVTDALNTLLNQLVQKKFPRPEDRGGMAEVRATLLNHKCFPFDPWSAAEERHDIAQVKRCNGMLEGLKVRLQREEMRYKGIEAATRQPELILAKLKDQSLRMLELSDNLHSANTRPTGPLRARLYLFTLRDRLPSGCW